MNLIEEMKNFFLNPDVLKFAIAAVFSQTFYPIIQSFVNDVILPLLDMVIPSVSIGILGISFNNFLGNIFIFIISMIVLFFLFIKPFNILTDEKKNKKI